MLQVLLHVGIRGIVTGCLMVEGARWARLAPAPIADAEHSPTISTPGAQQSQWAAAVDVVTRRGGKCSKGATSAAEDKSPSSDRGRDKVREPVKRAAAGSLVSWLQRGKCAAGIGVAAAASAAQSTSSKRSRDGEHVPVVVKPKSRTLEPGGPPVTSHPGKLEPGPSSPATNLVSHADESGAKVHAPISVRLIWVSAEHRRRGIASKLLDAAREHVLQGHVLDRRQLAFEQPTDAGCSLARAFTRSERFWIT